MAEKLSKDSSTVQGWTTSIHCSYYAVLQYLKYLLAEKSKNPIGYDSQNTSAGTDSHSFIMNEIRNRITDTGFERQFAQMFRDLKQERIKADYTQKVFRQDESLDYTERASNLIKKLSKASIA